MISGNWGANPRDREFSVTVEAFGHVSVQNVKAATRREAEQKALANCRFKVESKERAT